MVLFARKGGERYKTRIRRGAKDYRDVLCGREPACLGGKEPGEKERKEEIGQSFWFSLEALVPGWNLN